LETGGWCPILAGRNSNDGDIDVSGHILVVSHFPSPYQVELFDRVAAARPEFAVAYLHRKSHGRRWTDAELGHRALFVAEANQWKECLELNGSAALVVYNYYQDRKLLQLLRGRAKRELPWAFWGERPGFKSELLGRVTRKVLLRELHTSSRPIWGIGSWAVEGYREEFGNDRRYVNLPYFSNLDRFASAAAAPRGRPVQFVYSGSLSHRKGVDLLAAAFARLVPDFPQVRLRIVGHGELDDAVRRTLAPVASQVEMCGFMDWRDVSKAYAGGHVLCVPSRHDGWALVVPEGLAAGLPVIATDKTGAAHDLISHGRNGWIVRADDGDAVFEAMRAAASMGPEEWSAMSEAAQRSVTSHTLAAGAVRFLAAADQAMADLR
jgi:glycosyltransferase involved in cell wall biosynthesis